jgi:transcriptional regulator with XRE-family HTH domain
VRPRRNAEEFVSQDGAAGDVRTGLASVGAKLRELRQARGWTQEELAELSGLGPDTIVRIETGRPGTEPNKSTLILLSLIFERKRDYLLNLMENIPQQEESDPTLRSVSRTLDEFRQMLTSIKEDVNQQCDILHRIAPAVGVVVEPWRHGSGRDTTASDTDDSR